MEQNKLDWRDNLHKIVKVSLNLSGSKPLPSIIIDAIDAAYVQGLEDGRAEVIAEIPELDAYDRGYFKQNLRDKFK